MCEDCPMHGVNAETRVDLDKYKIDIFGAAANRENQKMLEESFEIAKERVGSPLSAKMNSEV